MVLPPGSVSRPRYGQQHLILANHPLAWFENGKTAPLQCILFGFRLHPADWLTRLPGVCEQQVILPVK